MKKFKVISIFILMLMLTACGKAKLEDGKELVLKLDGLNLTANGFYDKLRDAVGINVLVETVDKTIVDSKYPTTATITSQINASIAGYKEQYDDQYLEVINYYSGTNFTTDAQLFEYIETNYKRELLIDDYAKSIITDEEITTYYNEKAIGDMRAKHILIVPDVTDTMTATEKTAAETAALNKAKELIVELNDGADFEELAKEHSGDSGSASNGGDVGYFNRGDMVDEFEDATVALEVGKYTTTPVKSEFGYHIILKTEQLEKGTLETLKEEIKSILATEKKDTIANIYAFAIEQAMEEFNLEIYDTEMKNLYENYIRNLKNKTE